MLPQNVFINQRLSLTLSGEAWTLSVMYRARNTQKCSQIISGRGALALLLVLAIGLGLAIAFSGAWHIDTGPVGLAGLFTFVVLCLAGAGALLCLFGSWLDSQGSKPAAGVLLGLTQSLVYGLRWRSWAQLRPPCFLR